MAAHQGDNQGREMSGGSAIPAAPELSFADLFPSSSVSPPPRSPGSPLTVGFDLGVLGLGHSIERARTGVFRVAEQVVKALGAHPNCTLAPAAFRHYYKALQYWKSDENPLQEVAEWQHDKYISWADLHLRRVYSTIALCRQEYQRGSVFDQLFPLLHEALRMLDLGSYPPGEAWLDRVDLFYSAYYSIPQEIIDEKIPHFLTIHDLIPIHFPDWFEWNEAAEIKKIIHSLGDRGAYVCVSESTRRDLLNYLDGHIDPSRVGVAHLAADPGVFYPCQDQEKWAAVREKYELPDSAYFLSLCTLEPRKNIELVIRAFGQLLQQEKVQDLSLVLVGSTGWKHEAVTQALEESGIHRDRILLPGFVDEADLASIYSHALGFVYPSRYEGFGLPPLEAMQCGTPAIVSNRASLPEVVGNAGILIDPDDCDGLSEAMLTWYNHPGERQRFAALALEQAKRFTWHRAAETLLTMGRRLLSQT